MFIAGEVRTERGMTELTKPSRMLAPHGLAPRLLYVVTEDWYFLSHRLPMARAAVVAGFDVHVATNVAQDGREIEREGFILHPIRFGRGRLSPFQMLRTILALRKIYRVVDPAIVHYVAMQPTVLGTVSSLWRRSATVYAITGRGHIFVADTGVARALRRVILVMLRFGLNRRRAVGLVQNPDDCEWLIDLGVKPEHVTQIAGSGVDVDRFQPIPEPDGPVTIAFVGRMLTNKGVRTLVEAQRRLRASHILCELLLAGAPDPANPTSIPEAEVAQWGREPGVTWLGHVADVATVWRQAHIAVLPSHGEGVPKSLLEAAASGRPMIATDVPGCREVVIHEKTGLLVPVDDPQALAAAILRLVNSSAQRIRFGDAARRLVDERFSADLVGKETVALYRRLLKD
jgi:glycosyltransferase involved in cell wall biosynthesis